MSDEAPPPIQPTKSPVGCLGFALAGASFIPLLGVPIGLVAIIWGILRRSWGMVAIGAGGILFTVVLYSSLFYFGFVKRGGVYDTLRTRMAVTMLNETVKEIEYYKLQHGHYPAEIRDLDSTNKQQPWAVDPTFMQRKGTNAYFFYQLDPTGASYNLRSVGQDGVPFTPDDILPSISEEERKHTGLKVDQSVPLLSMPPADTNAPQP